MPEDIPTALIRPLVQPTPDLLPGVNRTRVRGTIYRIVRDLDAVDDIEQEVSLKWEQMRRRWALLQYKTAYVCTMAKHASYAWLKRRREEEDRLKHYSSKMHPLLPGTEVSPAELLQIGEDLEHFMADLPDRSREAWRWRLLGLTHKEIARRMDVQPTTVKDFLERTSPTFARLVQQLQLNQKEEGGR